MAENKQTTGNSLRAEATAQPVLYSELKDPEQSEVAPDRRR
jgi:hypothetical protein